MWFRSTGGVKVPAVTAAQMREVDRLAVEEFQLGILQMMENAGRSLALHAMEMLGIQRSETASGQVLVLAGAGGNGGGGLCCARHLHNRGLPVQVVLDREAAELAGAASNQLSILRAAGVQPADPARAAELISQSAVVVDALTGYGLRGAPQGQTARLIALCCRHASRMLRLDVPSGLDATSGQAPGVMVRPERTLTLALPKTGLECVPGELYLADLGIPSELYTRLGLTVAPFFGRDYWVRLQVPAYA